MRKRILIVVDNPLRDLASCTLLAQELSADHDVFLCSMSQARFEAFRVNADLVLLNYLRITNVPMVRNLIRSGIAFSVLDTEGGIFAKIPGTNETTYTKTIISQPDIRAKISHYFVWGKALWRDLKSRDLYPEQALLCLGTPRMDFYHPSFAPFYLDSGRSPARPMILINTSFSLNNPKFSTRDKESATLIAKFNYPADFVQTLFSNLDLVLQAYLSLTRFLAESRPELDFVLRPHPFEDLKIYEDFFRGLANIKVDSSDTVAPWIFRSQALIHYECSTAIEAGFAQKPAISLEKFKDIRPNENIAKITAYASSAEDALSLIDQIVSGKYKRPDHILKSLQEIDEELYFRVDGQAYHRIAEVIRQWQKPQKTWLQHAFHGLYLGIFSLRTLLKKAVKGRLVPSQKAFSTAQVDDALTKLSFLSRCKAKPMALSTSIQILPKA